MTTSKEVTIEHEVGLHARPAAIFAKQASQFTSTISIENITKGSAPVNAKSVLRLLSAGIQAHDRLRITAEGEDAQDAVTVLYELIHRNFQEAQ
ncbi:HPr family phosphocarrier protein [Ktedonospora formicarum]|uniref:Phosphocarrier protein HPr n=1 Tax=Ktedonospora formicarum TaxID=2778364 RepID=A0A8J3HVI5_9CHLR|nr:HPr family phosphocarrier protein [Ktedonospora formicarum]GHO42751.1 phosphotransferase [Ktedonospora formicarum]